MFSCDINCLKHGHNLQKNNGLLYVFLFFFFFFFFSLGDNFLMRGKPFLYLVTENFYMYICLQIGVCTCA